MQPPQTEPEENMFLPECEITGSAALTEYKDIHCPKLSKHYDNLPRLRYVYLLCAFTIISNP